MTEAEWLACPDPDALLQFLRGAAYDRRRPQPSRRKLRLFACACCRRVWPSLVDARSRHAVEVAERYADHRATRRELALAFIAAKGINPIGNAGLAAALAAAPSGACDRAAVQAALAGDLRCWETERAAQARLLRDLFGNPFRPPPALRPEWLIWDDGALPRLARALYAERAFDRLPALADALAAAGCSYADVLTHCREAGEHVRGCWAVDWILAKE